MLTTWVALNDSVRSSNKIFRCINGSIWIFVSSARTGSFRHSGVQEAINMSSTTKPSDHVKTLLILSVTYRIFHSFLFLVSSYIPAFDNSHLVLWPTLRDETPIARWISTTLRWDVFHFQAIAKKGYIYEHLFAFLPGVPILMRASSMFTQGSDFGLLFGGWSLAMLCWTTGIIYEHTLLLTKSEDLAMLASACSLLSSSPATLMHAPYAEPFFAFFSHKGMFVHTFWYLL